MEKINGKKMREYLQKRQAAVIDTSSRNDYQNQHINGSVNIPLDEKEFSKKVQKKFKDFDGEVVLCTRSDLGEKVEQKARELKQVGYQQVFEYRAQPKEWEQSNLSIMK